MAGHGVGVTSRLAVLALGEGGLRHERTDAGVVGLTGELCELLVDDRQFGAQVAQAGRHLAQPAFDPRP